MDAIVAVYSDWGIGRDGTQPLVLPEDRRHFRLITGSGAVIVGRRTLADFPGGRPLPGRRNIVLTRQEDLVIPGAELTHSPEAALALVRDEPSVFVIGGESVYRALFLHIRRVYVTRIDACPASDAFFPDLDRDGRWKITARSGVRSSDGLRYEFLTYERDTRCWK